MITLNLLMIAVIMVLILDIADFRTTIKQIVAFFLSKYLKREVKYENLKFNVCCLCAVWWLGLLYLLITGNLTLFYIMILLVIACMTPLIKDTFYLIYDFIQAIIIYLSNKTKF